ncbi:unnamed protein product, partial [Phaeothamnion confervicola]
AATLVVETLFLALLQTSQPRHMQPYLHRTLMELCREAPKTVPPAVARGVGLVFRKLPGLDPLAAQQFASWFAHHLANSEYKWPFWQHFAFAVELPQDHPHRVFVATVFDALVRLSYVDRIKETLPKSLHTLLPPSPVSVAVFVSPAAAGAGAAAAGAAGAAAEETERLVRSKEEADAVRTWLDSVRVADGSGAEFPADSVTKAMLLTHAILRAGDKTPTHTSAGLDRYGALLAEFCRGGGAADEVEAGQAAVVSMVGEVWQQAPQWFVLATGMLLRRGVVSPTVAAAYVLSDENSNGLAFTPSLWDALKLTIAVANE